MKAITILTLNAGLLDVEILGHKVLESAPFEKERLAALPTELLGTDADIIALQEVYEQSHRSFLIKELRGKYPHHFYSRQRRLFRLEDSLIIFSKYPIVRRKVIAYTNSVFDERILTYKGVLVAKIHSDVFGSISVFNTHTVTGGIRDQENRTVEDVRAMQIEEMIRGVENSKGHDIKIIVGDMNTGPEVAKENYDMLLNRGYIDVVALKHPYTKKKTWDPRNVLNREGHYSKSPPQRIDHIFLRESDVTKLKIVKAEIILDKPTIRVVGGGKITISDHAGVLVTFSRV